MTDIGARIALLRKHRQLTQHGLAALANVSYSLLTKVESGSRPASEGFIAACARALGVEVSVLLGDSAPEVTQDQRLGMMLGRVRTQLDLYDLDPDETIIPRPLPVLRDAV
jgi:transcriptional regulator with XRE-family HTH domain